MGDHRTTASVTGALLALIVLTGCAAESSTASSGPSTSSAQAGTATGAPTDAAGTNAASGDGAGPGGDSPPQYGLNKRHHDRTDLSAESAAALDVARAQVERSSPRSRPRSCSRRSRRSSTASGRRTAGS